MLKTLSDYQGEYLSLESWHEWWTKLVATVSTALLSSRRDVNNDESPAVEVLNYRSPEGYFASMLIYIARCLNDHLHLLKKLA